MYLVQQGAYGDGAEQNIDEKEVTNLELEAIFFCLE